MARSTSVSPGTGTRPDIRIPLDPNRTGTVAQRADRATRWLWSCGIYPSPSAVNMRMRGATRDCLNGIETTARNAVFDQLGITRQRNDKRFQWRKTKEIDHARSER